ncbi:hypothetical protein J6590_097202 [Homalodisca vitripennis]|nr:hypothetical protein J6590_097202 [Homalodisca vitripennis]
MNVGKYKEPSVPIKCLVEPTRYPPPLTPRQQHTACKNSKICSFVHPSRDRNGLRGKERFAHKHCKAEGSRVISTWLDVTAAEVSARGKAIEHSCALWVKHRNTTKPSSLVP